MKNEEQILLSWLKVRKSLLFHIVAVAKKRTLGRQSAGAAAGQNTRSPVVDLSRIEHVTVVFGQYVEDPHAFLNWYVSPKSLL